MKTSSRITRHLIVAPALALSVAMIAGCGAGGDVAGNGVGSTATGASTAKKDAELAALVPQKYRDAGKIRVAALAGQVPMMFVGDDGKTLIGVEADILKDIGGILGVNVELTDTKFDTIVPGIAAGRYDLAAGSITSTAERKKQVDFVTYAKYGQALAVQTGNPQHVDFKSTCGKRIAVLNGGIQQTAMLPELTKECQAQGKPAVAGQSFPDLDSTFLSLKSGRTDAVLLNEVVVQYRAAASNGAFETADRGYRSDTKGIVLSKQSDLGPAVLGAVQKLQTDGTMKSIFDKWQVGSAVTDSKLEKE